MLPVYLFTGVILAVMIAAWAVQKMRRKTGVLNERHFALPPGWLKILRENVPLYNRMPLDLRVRMQDAVINFVDGRRWRHCGGLESVTAEMKVTIAAQACFLMLARVGQPNLVRIHNVMVYPKSSLTAPEDSENALPPVDAWPSATVVLVWDDERKTALDLRDEHNGVLRDFAARLNPAEGGLPAHSVWRHTPWARAMTEQFVRHAETVPQAAALPEPQTDEETGEFFAAATELFFELPDRLRSRNADLYALLRSFFKLDPVKWQPAR